jgi:MFS family permease
LGHAARFGIFAMFPIPAVAVAANILHGICYAFFFATVYIFVDEFFPKDVRSSAQGLFNLLILGIGPLLGNFLGTRLGAVYVISPQTGGGGIDYSRMFLLPAGAALVAATILALLFHPPEKAAEPAAGKPAQLH